MKKTLLTLVTLVFAMFTANAQTNLIENGDFETWAEGQPVNWKSTTTASSAVLEQSTDAHAGAYSVLVKGASGNKRIAYKELTLKAGTYKMHFFAKAATAENASVRPGYAPLKEDGKLGNYEYGTYVNDITNAAWVEVNHEFTLTETTSLNVLVMNPKKPGKDVLVDDFSLTTTDGGIDNGGSVDPEPQPEPQPEDNAIFSETFAEGMGAFTIEDKVVSDSVATVWKHDGYKGKNYMKASAFFHGKGYAVESWMVSPVIDLTKASNSTLTFDQAANYFKGFEGYLVKVKAEGGEWADLNVANKPEKDSWNFVTSTADLKAFDGKKIQIAFVYIGSVEKCGTWEVMNVKVDGKTATGIEGVEAAEGAQVIYDMSGRRVAKAVKGLYIVNGKKVYVK